MNKKISKIVGWMWLIGALIWASMGEIYPLGLLMAVAYVAAGRYYIKNK